MDLGLLLTRCVLGLGVAAHGAQKLFGWFGGPGPGGTRAFLAGIGFPSSPALAFVVGLAELLGGLLAALGFLGPTGPALVIVVMVTAIGSVHLRHGFFADRHGMELPLAYAVGMLLVAVSGAGVYSVDAAIRFDRFVTPERAWEAIGAAVAAGLVALVFRRPYTFDARAAHAPNPSPPRRD